MALPIKEFISACAACDVVIETPVLTAVLLDESLDTKTCSTVLAIAASCPVDYKPVWGADARTARLWQRLGDIIDWAVVSDEWKRVLLSVSRLPPSTALVKIPDPHLAELWASGGEYQKAANRLTLGSLRWKECEAEAVAQRACDADSDQPGFLRSLLVYIDISGSSGAKLEAFLVSLLARDRNALAFDVISRATGLLIKLLQRRAWPSTVPDPAQYLASAAALRRALPCAFQSAVLQSPVGTRP